MARLPARHGMSWESDRNLEALQTTGMKTEERKGTQSEGTARSKRRHHPASAFSFPPLQSGAHGTSALFWERRRYAVVQYCKSLHFRENFFGHKKAQKTQNKTAFPFCAFCAFSWLSLFGCGVSRAVFFRG